MNVRWLMSIAATAVVAGALVACGGGDDDEDTGGAASGSANTVNVELGEWRVTPDKSSAAAGQIAFKTSNKGAVPHELKIVQTDLPADKLPTADGKADESKLRVVGTTEEFQAGKSVEKTWQLAAGKYVLICNVPAHYQTGMRADFTVQ